MDKENRWQGHWMALRSLSPRTISLAGFTLLNAYWPVTFLSQNYKIPDYLFASRHFSEGSIRVEKIDWKALQLSCKKF